MSEIPEALMTYLVKRETERAEKIAAVLASFTDRERALVKDAAVMGYVRGTMHPKGEKHPKDSAVLAEVIDACLAFPDLYPAINAGLHTEPCTHCGGSGADPEDPGDWDSAVGMHNPTTRGPCPVCDGSGDTPAP